MSQEQDKPAVTGSFTDADGVVGTKAKPEVIALLAGAATYALVKGRYRLTITESLNKKEVFWKLNKDRTLIASGTKNHFKSAKSDMDDALKKVWEVETDKLPIEQLRFTLDYRPSEADMTIAIYEAFNGFKVPESELVAYQLPELGYSAMACRPLEGTWIRRDADGIYEARMGLVLFGSLQDPDSNVDNPFADGFYENYAKGRAERRETAIKLMLIDAASIGASLW